MKQGQCTVRQLMTLMVVALLSPAIRLLPSGTTGAGEWLSTVSTLPVALLVGWTGVRLFSNLPEGMGLLEGYGLVFGKWVGKIIAFLYIGWGILLLTTYLRLAGVRLLTTGYENNPLILFITILVVAVGWLTTKGLAPLLRTGQIFFLVLTAVVAFTLILSIPQMEVENILPLWVDDVAEGMSASYYPISLLGFLAFGGCAMGGVTKKEGDGKKVLLWIGGLWVVLTLIQLAVTATFGATLISSMERPFFIMSRGISVVGVFERVEAVVVALWIVSDLIFLALITYGTGRALCYLAGERAKKGGHWGVLGIAWVGALWIVTQSEKLNMLEYQAIPLGNVVLGLLLPMLLWVVYLARKKWKKGVDKGGSLWYTN